MIDGSPGETTVVRLCRLDEIDDGGMARFELDGFNLAVIRIEDKVYGLEDRCSHQNVPLSTGEVDTDECLVVCTKHGAAFDVETGEALILPATRPVPTYDLAVEDGEVLLVLS
ncbi:MAG: non-heme iron oxygenase ferredoxin subunit [Microthrixaceae bacterium]|nr:non-heme iron oxygenase ferredoxin subunit [Microthrixaceae bacterium]MCO5313905.1 non-heme iron oxygenase ferredoxin subunit [Microthrixaceae bacterium]HPB44834.1 non-heme iron oxygenase ferredoxin subunit [Microthrixaceae bacterium]